MRVLLIDNNTESRNKLKSDIKDHYIVDSAKNSDEGIYLSQVNDYSAIVVDSHKPDFCSETRKFDDQVPILMLLSQNNFSKRIDSLTCGADAVLTKPITSEEVLAYLNILINRTYNVGNKKVLTSGDITLDLDLKQVTYKGEEVSLRKKEYDLLHYLMINANRIVSKEQILENVWESGCETFSNTVEVHIKSLRDKLGKDLIKTTYGFGYKLSY